MTTSNQPPVLKVVESATKPARKKSGNTGNSGGGSGSDKVQNFGEYLVKNGMFHQSRLVKGVTAEIPLCDFTCKIVEEITQDNDLQNESFLRIKGIRADGKLLWPVDVPNKSFYGSQGGWVNEHWGTTAFLNSGTAKKDNLRAAIELYSKLNGDIPKRVIYKFTGWKKISDQWHYLTGSGAITTTGLIDTVETDLGSGHMRFYSLPAPLTGEELKRAVTEALALLNICPAKPHIGSALLAAVVRAPLGECHPIDFVVWLYGLTGSRKSEIAALAMAFYGGFNSRRFPATWADTITDLKIKAHQSKDAIFSIDDYKPSVSKTEAEKLGKKAEDFLRGTGNQGGKGRRTATLQAIPAAFNRSLTIISGEDMPKGQSLLARSLMIEMARTDVDDIQFSKLQQAAANGLFSGLMSCYIQWLAPRLDQFKHGFPAIVIQRRDKVAKESFTSSHPRAPEIFANLVSGFDLFLDFLRDLELMTTEQCDALLLSVETNLKQVFNEQSAYQVEQDEVQRFLELLKGAFSSGNCHIAERLKKAPPEKCPYFWGWRKDGKDLNNEEIFKPMGDCIGYLNEQTSGGPCEVWLVQENAFKIAAQFARNQGDCLLISMSSLWRRMVERGLVIKTETDAKSGKPRSTVKKNVAGVSQRVMVLSADLFEAD
ncbi:MAG: cell wall-binding protein [Methylococcaceae bacterium]|nr:cell wall-binding protein [Methylococcaceae bacterium]MDZ4219067.1 cell wall-binding protein [Methylobacter sp.]MDP2394120.1 cell wall-binding protein [Methylococcaceae bacterium]MDP3019151.1 cell wall-binding protein [Methylococcaceae bacterium]MDP3388690.1 cell wall-binding protein [Methylococcaceae bacterium]